MAANIPDAQSSFDLSEYRQIELERKTVRAVPWHYAREQFEIAQHRGELAMLDRVISAGVFSKETEDQEPVKCAFEDPLLNGAVDC
jgi:hypothetical protein